MSTALIILAAIMLAGFAGTTILCAATTIIRNRARGFPRLHEMEARHRYLAEMDDELAQFQHRWVRRP